MKVTSSNRSQTKINRKARKSHNAMSKTRRAYRLGQMAKINDSNPALRSEQMAYTKARHQGCTTYKTDRARTAVRSFYHAAYSQGLTVDHKVCLSRAGSHTLRNLQMLSLSDNISKGSSTMKQWSRRLALRAVAS